MKKIFSTIRFAVLLAAAVVLIFSFAAIERLKVLKGKEAKADVPGGSTSGDGSSGSSTSGGDGGVGVGDGSGDSS